MRWLRGQKFYLTAQGVAAEAAYRAGLVGSRLDEGRASFNGALQAWATPLNVQAEDGPYLSELSSGALSLTALLGAFEGCGRSPEESKAAIERLIAAGLVLSP